MVAESSEFHLTLKRAHRVHFFNRNTPKKRDILSEKRESGMALKNREFTPESGTVDTYVFHFDHVSSPFHTALTFHPALDYFAYYASFSSNFFSQVFHYPSLPGFLLGGAPGRCQPVHFSVNSGADQIQWGGVVADFFFKKVSFNSGPFLYISRPQWGGGVK